VEEAQGGQRAELAALGIRLTQARLRASVVEAAESAEVEHAVAALLQDVLRVGDASLAARWFLGTQGVRSQLAMWPERGSLLAQHDLVERLPAGAALALMARAPDGGSLLLALVRDHERDSERDGDRENEGDSEGRAALRLRCARADETPDEVVRTLQAMVPDVADIALVPVGELRGIAWQHHAALALPQGVRLRVHLTVAAWWRLREDTGGRQLAPPTDSTAPSARCPPTWLLAAHDAWNTGNLDDRLPWVQVESFLSHRLWNPGSIVLLQEGSAAPPPATALLACGHGTASDFGGGGRKRGAGLATTLPRLPTLRQMLLHCCEMGKVSEVAGDPQGLLAQGFTLGLRFAMAPLTRVHDFDMTLFSLAYQWCLRCAYDQPSSGADVDWVHVFELLQASLRMGEWPPGFARWLAAELPGAFRHAVPDVPAARADEDAEIERKDWFHVLRALSIELAMPDTVPRPSRCWNEFYDSVSLALSQRAPDRIRTTAQGMVAIGE
jgi:hypothetical protein